MEILDKYQIVRDQSFKIMREHILDYNSLEIVGHTIRSGRNTWLDTNAGGLRLVKMQLSAFADRS